MHRVVLALAALAAAAAFLPGSADAAGGSYIFAGGTAAQQATVKRALDASSFNWSLVPATVTIRIGRGLATEAVPGEIRFDADLLNSGTYAWGVVQHEYAHQVDFFLLNPATRATLLSRLGAATWWGAGLRHDQLGGERFASTLAWAYWQSSSNVMRPTSAQDEAGSMAPATFRALLDIALGTASASVATAPQTPAKAPAVPKRPKR